MKKLAWVILLTFVTIALFSQEKITSEQYIEMYFEIAVRKMHEYKIPASITLAQGILESGNGNSNLAKNAKNHFGIKCHSDWTGKGYYMDDDAANECFRVYETVEASYADHSQFLTSRARYKFLFEDYETDDYKNWAKGLKKAGYATNPNYANLLISIIDRYELHQYDKMEYIPATTAEPVIADIVEGEFEDILPFNAYYTNEALGIFIYNRIETVKSKGRNPLEIANVTGVPLAKLLSYNDMYQGDVFLDNQNVFLQPKRKKGSQKKHRVQEGQTMYEISQMYGIKLSSLYKKNKLTPNEQPLAGEMLTMRKKNKDEVKAISYEEFLQKERMKELPQIPVKDIVKDQVAPKPEKEKQEIIEEVVVPEVVKEEVKPNAPIIEEGKDIIAENIAKNPEYHIVEAGQTLYAISNLYYVTVEELMSYNGLKNYSLEKGQLLRLRPKENEEEPTQELEEIKEAAPEVEQVILEDITTHVVAPGETMYAISRKYNVSIPDLQKWNNLPDYNLKVGQVLLVSP